MTLRDLSVKIKAGSLTCIIGDVGSGKSSLLSTLIGDVRHLDKDFVMHHEASPVNDVLKELLRDAFQEKPDSAPVIVPESLSYTQQVPWIENKTIRANVTAFGEPLTEENKNFYQHVIKICELTRDLEIMPAADGTEIGEKGINLSGG